jgi:hypothetical protein
MDNQRCEACGEWTKDHAMHELGDPACAHDTKLCFLTMMAKVVKELERSRRPEARAREDGRT